MNEVQLSSESKYEIGKSPIIKGLVPGLTEIGKIKIGKKGEARQKQGGNGTYQLPVKLNHFLITTLERDKDNNFIVDREMMKLCGGEQTRRIPVMLLFNNIESNFQCRFTCYNGKTLWCSGDGEAAFRMKADKTGREQVKCPCGRQEPTYANTADKCKMNGKLSVVIRGANCVGGVWTFRTTGYNSTVGLLSSMILLSTLTGGHISGIPLTLTWQQKVGTNPITGEAVTVPVVGIVFDGDIAALQKNALQLTTEQAQFSARMLSVEKTVQRLISADAALIDEAGDITEEYYPEEQPVPELAEPSTAPAGVTEPAPVTAPAPAARKPRATKKTVEEPSPEPEQTQEQIEEAAPAPTLQSKDPLVLF